MTFLLLRLYSTECPVCMCVLSHSAVSDSLQPHGLQPSRLLCSWDSLGKNTRVGCHSLLQGIFLTLVSCMASESLLSEPPGKPIECPTNDKRLIFYLDTQMGPSGVYVQDIHQNKSFHSIFQILEKNRVYSCLNRYLFLDQSEMWDPPRFSVKIITEKLDKGLVRIGAMSRRSQVKPEQITDWPQVWN